MEIVPGTAVGRFYTSQMHIGQFHSVSVFQTKAVVYDMRSGTAVSEETSRISVDHSVNDGENNEFIKRRLANHGFHPPFNSMYIDTDSVPGHTVIVLLENIKQKERLIFVRLKTSRGCKSRNQNGKILVYINPTSESCISTLVENLKQTDVLKGYDFTLYVNNLKLTTDMVLRQFMEYFTTIDCYVHEPIDLKIKYKIEDDIEKIFTVHCNSFKDISTLKDKLLQRFGGDFETVMRNDDKMWFVQNDRILSENTLCGEDIDTQLEVKVYPKQYIPVTLIYRSKYLEDYVNFGQNTRKVLHFVSPHWSTAVLCQDIGRKLNQPPNSLSLSVKKKNIREVEFVADMSEFVSSCTINVTREEGFELQAHSRKYGEHYLKVFKQDSIFDVKTKLAFKLSVEPLFIRVFRNQQELLNDAMLKAHGISCDTTINFTYDKRARFFSLRQSGQDRKIITIYKPATCTIGSIKEQISLNANEMNMVYKGKVLSDSTVVGELDMGNGDEVVVTRGPGSLTGSAGVKVIFLVSSTGRVDARLMKEENGIIFYAPETVTLEDFKNRTAKKQTISQEQCVIGNVTLDQFLSSRPTGYQSVRGGHKRSMDMHTNLKNSKRRKISTQSSTSDDCIDQTESGPNTKVSKRHKVTSAGQTNNTGRKSTSSQNEDKHIQPLNNSASCHQPSTSTSKTEIQNHRSKTREEVCYSGGFVESANYPSKGSNADGIAELCPAGIEKQDVAKIRASSCSERDQNYPVFLKEYHYRKTTEKHKTNTLVREVATYEEIVSNEEGEEIFWSRKPMLTQSSLEGSVCEYSTGGETETSVVLQKPEIDNRILQHTGRELGREWMNFALEQLDVSHTTIEKFEVQYSKDITMQAFMTLKHWRDSMGSGATLPVLKEKLEAFGKRSIAEALSDLSRKNYDTA